MHKVTLPFSGTSGRGRRLLAGAAAAALALGISATGAAPAQSDTDPSCPAAYPVTADTDNAALRGMAVHGLTVTSGESPETFTGRVLDTYESGIGPGVPMIIMKVTSSNITDHGIWEGMSGSPVYTADGRLLGAVAYGFSASPSPIAGVTPASYMQKLLASTPGTASAASAPASVTLPRATMNRIVASGAMTSAQAASDNDISALRTPFGISGLDFGKRRQQLAARLGLSNVRTLDAGGTAPSTQQIPVVAGGNLAASISYGDITAAGVGTATAVCGSEVLAFGHPMTFMGASTLSMHGADAITIQDDLVSPSFKIANLGAPVGTIDQDRRAGLHGLLGPRPTAVPITSTVTANGSSRTGSTYVTVPNAVPDLTLAHVAGDQDMQIDRIGAGSGRFTYTVNVTRGNGTHQTITRSDVYADPSDISYGDLWDLANLVYTLASSEDEKVTIDSVTTSSTLADTYQHYKIAKVQMWRKGTWHTLSQDRVLRAWPGATMYVKVFLSSPQLGAKVVHEHVVVPRRIAGKFGMLNIFGGNTGAGDPEQDGSGIFVDASGTVMGSSGSSSEPTLDEQLKALATAPHHDEVRVDTTWFDMNTEKQTNHRWATKSMGKVVDGSVSIAMVPFGMSGLGDGGSIAGKASYTMP